MKLSHQRMETGPAEPGWFLLPAGRSYHEQGGINPKRPGDSVLEFTERASDDCSTAPQPERNQPKKRAQLRIRLIGNLLGGLCPHGSILPRTSIVPLPPRLDRLEAAIHVASLAPEDKDRRAALARATILFPWRWETSTAMGRSTSQWPTSGLLAVRLAEYGAICTRYPTG